MRKHKIVGALLGLSLVVAAVPARANGVCIVPHQPAVFCSGTNGCTGSATTYNCYGYTSSQTCSCSATVSCCGHAVGPALMACGTSCVGCQPDGRTLAKAGKPKSASPTEVRPTKAAPAALQPKATTPAAIGPTDGRDR